MMLSRLKGDKKLVTLILMLLCGAALIVLSYLWSEQEAQPRAQDLTYTEGSVEERLSEVLSRIAGAGRVDVLVTQDEEGVCGVLVVAEGARELTVRTDLMRAAMTALDVPAESVEVFARSKEAEE